MDFQDVLTLSILVYSRSKTLNLPKMAELRLYDLSDSVLAHLFANNFSWAAIMLYKCGNQALNMRLCRGGITSIALYDYDSKSTSRWPQCLKEFKGLRSLKIVRPTGPLATPKTIRSELKQFSSSLKSLKLSADDALKVIIKEPSTAQTTLDAGDEEPAAKRPKLRETQAGLEEGEKHEERWNIDNSWPQLETLSIVDSFRASADLTPADLAMLPRSLTHFNCKQAICTSTDLSVLPPKLRKLKLALGGIVADALATLPRSLTELGNSLSKRAVARWLEDRSLLPPTVSDRLLLNYSQYPTVLAAIAKGTLQWPENIEALTIQDPASIQVLENLPQSLVELVIISSFGEGRLPVDLNWLNSCIVPMSKLAVFYVDLDLEWPKIDAEIWPSSLTHMELAAGISCENYHRLPRALQRLISETPLSEVTAPELKTLLDFGRRSLLASEQQWQAIKAALSDGTVQRAKYISEIESGRLFGLPLSLKSVILLNRDLKGFILPPLVTKLDLNPTPGDFTEFMVSSLPPPLTSLTIALQPDRIESLASVEGLSGSNRETSSFYNLKNLKELDLDLDILTNTAGVVKLLPPSLRSLYLKTLKGRLLPEHLKDLPPNLETLHIESRPVPLQNWLHTIPRSVTRLILPQNDVLASDLINLPPNIERITLSVVDMNLDAVLSVPKSVSEFVVVKSASNNSPWFPITLLRAFRPFYTILQQPREFLQSELDLLSQALPVATPYRPIGDDEYDEEDDEVDDPADWMFEDDEADEDGDDVNDGDLEDLDPVDDLLSDLSDSESNVSHTPSDDNDDEGQKAHKRWAKLLNRMKSKQEVPIADDVDPRVIRRISATCSM